MTSSAKTLLLYFLVPDCNVKLGWANIFQTAIAVWKITWPWAIDKMLTIPIVHAGTSQTRPWTGSDHTVTDLERICSVVRRSIVALLLVYYSRLRRLWLVALLIIYIQLGCNLQIGLVWALPAVSSRVREFGGSNQTRSTDMKMQWAAADE